MWNQYTLSISCYIPVNHTHHEGIHKRISELRGMTCVLIYLLERGGRGDHWHSTD